MTWNSGEYGIHTDTAEQQKEMLDAIGLTMADLFGDMPPELMAKSFNLPQG